MSPKDTAYIVEHLAIRFMAMVDYERQLSEHRAAFGARTEADAKIIEGLRKERDGLLTQVQDMREEIIRVNDAHGRTIVERDALRAEVAALQWRWRMTNEELLSVAEIVERATKRFNEQAALHKVRCDQYDQLIADMKAEHEAKMVEHRAAFGARTKADAETIDRLHTERDALRAEVADLRGIFDMVHASLGIKCGDHIGKAIEALKQRSVTTPKRTHPVAVGEYLRRLTGFSTTPAGEVAQVLHVDSPTTEYTVKRPNGQQGVWLESGCEPCDPPVDHDTEAGKAAAEAALKSESVTDIKVGDLVEVVSNRGRNTWLVDVGSLGIVTSVEDINDSISVHLDDVPGKRNALAGYVSFCDVRKVTT